jgi:hypothetical protein
MIIDYNMLKLLIDNFILGWLHLLITHIILQQQLFEYFIAILQMELNMIN